MIDSTPRAPGSKRVLADTLEQDAPLGSVQTVGEALLESPSVSCRDVAVHYGDKQALFDINLDMGANEVLALIGPSGCGKTTFLRCINRMNDTIEGCRVSGTIKIDDEEISHADADVVSLRSRVGMVFQKPNPFPKSIYDNIAYGPRIHGLAASKVVFLVSFRDRAHPCQITVDVPRAREEVLVRAHVRSSPPRFPDDMVR